MEMFLVLAVILGVAVFLIRKRNAEKAKPVTNITVEQAAPRVVVPEKIVEPVSAEVGMASRQAELSAVDVIESVQEVSVPVEIEQQAPKAVSSMPLVDREERVPEDSMLRRHYESACQAEREAITNPYPTDSALRRHYQSMSAIKRNELFVAKEIETPAQSATTLILPEDSMLRRHFLTQVQAEVEAQLFQRPTDSALSRHYDNLVKEKMEAYLKGHVA